MEKLKKSHDRKVKWRIRQCSRKKVVHRLIEKFEKSIGTTKGKEGAFSG